MSELALSEADARLASFDADDEDPFAPAPEVGETAEEAPAPQESTPETRQAVDLDTLVVDDLGIDLPDGVKGKPVKEALAEIERQRKQYASAYHGENRLKNENESLKLALEILKGNQSAPVQPPPAPAPQPYAEVDPDKDLWSDPRKTLRSVHDSAVQTAKQEFQQKTQFLERKLEDLEFRDASTRAISALEAARKQSGLTDEQLEVIKPFVASYVAANNKRLSPIDPGSYSEGIRFYLDSVAKFQPPAPKAPAVPAPPVASIKPVAAAKPSGVSTLTAADKRKISNVAGLMGMPPEALEKRVEGNPELLKQIRGGRG